MTGFVDNNEGLICDAVVRFLEEYTGHNRNDLSRPELEGGSGGVELLFNLGSNQYALEHTKIEPFPYQIKFDVHFCQVIQPVLEKIRACGLPKPGKYTLCLPRDVRVDAKATRLRELQSSLIQWIYKTAQELHAKHPKRHSRDVCPAGYYDHKTVRLDGFDFDITLERRVHWNNLEKEDGELCPGRPPPENMKEEQCERILTALKKKKKKLNHRKRLGAQTVLALENNHWPLTSRVEIGECIVELLPNQPGWLDKLFYMEAAFKPWTLYHWNWDKVGWDYNTRVFDPATLIDVSSKQDLLE